MQGNQVVNFVLKDRDGKPWDFRRDHRGKLILLDFWGSWCPVCIQAMPQLKFWQDRYGPSGLEVVGIDYEPGTTSVGAQLTKISNIERLPKVNGFHYRILLGGDLMTCPLIARMQVRNYPTLILLDETGKILFRSEGLDPQMENVIRQNLGMR